MEVSRKPLVSPVKSTTVDLVDLVAAAASHADAKNDIVADTGGKEREGDKEFSATEGEGSEEELTTTSDSDRPTQHYVLDGETLARVAAKYDVTPSELAQYNKLGMGRVIFPGQILKVPPPAPPPPPKPETPPPKEDMEVIEYQFIKLKVRHITSGRGVVGGSILFTPNAVIFDPDPKDPLVEELEPEAFQIIAPMEFVVNAAIFLDFFPIGNTSNVTGREHPPSQIFRIEEPKPDRLSKTEDSMSGSCYSLSIETNMQQTMNQNNQKSLEQPSEEPKENESKADSNEVSETKDEGDKSGDKKLELSDIHKKTADQVIVRSEPYYLRLTMGRPVGREVSKSTPTMAYGLQTMMPEYWFIVPSKQVFNLYRFFMTWFPEIYVPFDLEEVHEMGFELIPEPDLNRTESNQSINSAARIIHKTMTLNSIDLDVLMPEMETESELLSDDQRKFLYRYLPPRVQGNKWSLLFSTAKDGYSLHSLYRKAALVDSPVLIVIQDTDHAVFGALITCPPVMSESFLGTGESWLFTFFPSFKIYEWSGENNYIVRGGQSALVIGSSQGHFGLWLDENFHQGRSMSVTTFNNKPLPGKEDFQINNIECWHFVDVM